MPASGGRWRRGSVVVGLLAAAVALDWALQDTSLQSVGQSLPIVVGVVLAGQWIQRPDSWFWRHGRQSAVEFKVALEPPALDRAVHAEIAAHRSWRTTYDDAGVRIVAVPPTWRSGARRLRFAWRAAPAGAEVRIEVLVPTPYDFGMGRRLARRIRDHIVQACGADDSSQDTKPV